LKLLLDVHHSRHAAARLRDRGYDVIAAADFDELARAADEELLRAATEAGRVVVTEDVADFTRLARAWAGSGDHHAGIVFTPPRRFRPTKRSYPDNLVRALASLLDDAPRELSDSVWWL
jgi:hypothetical protein